MNHSIIHKLDKAISSLDSMNDKELIEDLEKTRFEYRNEISSMNEFNGYISVDDWISGVSHNHIKFDMKEDMNQ